MDGLPVCTSGRAPSTNDASPTKTRAFTAAPGVRYWLSIQATTPSYSAHWGWRGGTTDNRFSITFYNGSTFNQTVDRAFALTP